MRGRTNISGGDVVVNGELKEFVVGEGQVIGKGDFVQYDYIKNFNNSLFDNEFNRYSIQIDQNRVLIIYKQGTSDTNTSFVSVFEYGENELNMIGQTIILENTVVLSQTGEKIFEENGKAYFAFPARQGNNPCALVIKIDLITNEMEYAIFSGDSSLFSDSVQGCIGKYKNEEPKFVLFSQREEDSNKYVDEFYKITIETTTDSFLVSGKKIGSLRKNTEDYSRCQLSCTENTITFVTDSESRSVLLAYRVGTEDGSAEKISNIRISSALTEEYGYIELVNVTNGIVFYSSFYTNPALITENGVYAQFGANTFKPTDKTYKITNVEKISDGIIIAQKDITEGYELQVLKYDEVTKQYSLSNVLNAFDNYSSGTVSKGGAISLGGDKYIVLLEKGYYVFTYKDDVIYAGEENKGIVKQYESGNALGFAKTGGTAGQNIKVYVPWGT